MFQPKDIIMVASENKHNHYQITSETPKIGDKVVTHEGILFLIETEEELKEALKHKFQVILPFILSAKQQS